MTYGELENNFSQQILREIEQILRSYHYDATQLVGILLAVQNMIPKHYIPMEVAYYLAERLELKITNLYDCITFYSALSLTPRAKYPIQLCDSVVCKINDDHHLYEMLKEMLNIEMNEVTYDGRFMLEKVPCFGACDIAPAVRVNGRVYGHLISREKISEMLHDFL